MEISFDGLEKLIVQLEGLHGSIENVAHTGMLQGATIVQGAAKKLCPVNDGNLRNSITVEEQSDKEISVNANAAHAIFVEFGTGAKGDPKVSHTTKKQWFVPADKINPASAKRYRLRRIDKVENGQVVQSWYILRPQKPQPFMIPAVTQSRARVKSRIASLLRKAIKEARNNA